MKTPRTLRMTAALLSLTLSLPHSAYALRVRGADAPEIQAQLATGLEEGASGESPTIVVDHEGSARVDRLWRSPEGSLYGRDAIYPRLVLLNETTMAVEKKGMPVEKILFRPGGRIFAVSPVMDWKEFVKSGGFPHGEKSGLLQVDRDSLEVSRQIPGFPHNRFDQVIVLSDGSVIAGGDVSGVGLPVVEEVSEGNLIGFDKSRGAPSPQVIRYNPQTWAEEARGPVLQYTSDLWADPGGNRIYIKDGQSSRLLRLNPVTLAVEVEGPEMSASPYLGFSPDGSGILVHVPDRGMTLLDSLTLKVKATQDAAIPKSNFTYYHAFYSPDGERLYFHSSYGPLFRVNKDSLRLEATSPESLQVIFFPPHGSIEGGVDRLLYATTPRNLIRLDPASLQIEARGPRIFASDYRDQTAFSRDGKELWIIDVDEKNRLAVLDTVTLAVKARGGPPAYQIQMGSDGRKPYVIEKNTLKWIRLDVSKGGLEEVEVRAQGVVYRLAGEVEFHVRRQPYGLAKPLSIARLEIFPVARNAPGRGTFLQYGATLKDYALTRDPASGMFTNGSECFSRCLWIAQRARQLFDQEGISAEIQIVTAAVPGWVDDNFVRIIVGAKDWYLSATPGIPTLGFPVPAQPAFTLSEPEWRRAWERELKQPQAHLVRPGEYSGEVVPSVPLDWIPIDDNHAVRISIGIQIGDGELEFGDPRIPEEFTRMGLHRPLGVVYAVSLIQLNPYREDYRRQATVLIPKIQLRRLLKRIRPEWRAGILQALQTHGRGPGGIIDAAVLQGFEGEAIPPDWTQLRGLPQGAPFDWVNQIYQDKQAVVYDFLAALQRGSWPSEWNLAGLEERVIPLERLREASSWGEVFGVKGNVNVAWEFGPDEDALIERAKKRKDLYFVAVDYPGWNPMLSEGRLKKLGFDQFPSNVYFVLSDMAGFLDSLPPALRGAEKIFVDFPVYDPDPRLIPYFTYENAAKLLECVVPRGEFILRTESRAARDALRRAAKKLGHLKWVAGLDDPVPQGDYGKPRTSWGEVIAKKHRVYVVRYRPRAIQAGLEENVHQRLSLLQEALSRENGVLLVDGSIFQKRTRLEEFIAWLPPQVGRVVVAGMQEDDPLRLRNPGIIFAGTLTDAAAVLVGLEEADRVLLLGNEEWGTRLQKMLPASIDLTVVAPQTGLEEILRRWGVPQAVLEAISASGLEQELETLRAA